MNRVEFRNFIWTLKKVKRIKHMPSIKKMTELYDEFCNSNAPLETPHVGENEQTEEVCSHSAMFQGLDEEGYEICTNCGYKF